MAQHRTRKDKEKAQVSRLKQVEQGSENGAMSYTFSSGSAAAEKKAGEANLLRVDQSYIVKDLTKTVSISSLLLFIIIGIYLYLRYN